MFEIDVSQQFNFSLLSAGFYLQIRLYKENLWIYHSGRIRNN